jgi:hypothetical protein
MFETKIANQKISAKVERRLSKMLKKTGKWVLNKKFKKLMKLGTLRIKMKCCLCIKKPFSSKP